MTAATRTPIAGTFTSAAGFAVKVHAATISQVVAMATATGAAETMRTSAAVIDACAEVEGLPEGVKPTDILTVADGKKVAEMAQGGSDADFT